MPSVAYYDGRFVSPDEPCVVLDERGHQFGDGIYEVVRVYGGRLFLLDWHLERMQRSLAAVGLANPHTHSEWTELLCEAVRRGGEAEAIVYWQVTRGAAPRAHVFPDVRPLVTVTVKPVANRPPDLATCICLPDDRWANAYVKTLNLLPNVIAKEIARRAGAAEALFIRNGHITEGGSSNAWFVKGEELYTAPANRYILAGVTRRFVMNLASELGLQVHEEAVSIHDLGSIDEIFMTGTTTEVLPVHRVLSAPEIEADLMRLPDEPGQSYLHQPVQWKPVWQKRQIGPVTARIMEQYAVRVMEFCNHGEDPVDGRSVCL